MQFDPSTIRVIKSNPRWQRRSYNEELFINSPFYDRPSPEREKLLRKLILETEFLYIDWMKECHPDSEYTQMTKKILKKYEQWKLDGSPLTSTDY